MGLFDSLRDLEKILVLALGLTFANACGKEEPASSCVSNQDCQLQIGYQFCVSGECFGPGRVCGSEEDCPTIESCIRGYCTYGGQPSCREDKDCMSGSVCKDLLCISKNYSTPENTYNTLVDALFSDDLGAVKGCFTRISPDLKKLSTVDLTELGTILQNSTLLSEETIVEGVVQRDYRTSDGEVLFMIFYNENDGWKVNVF
jgi:hypothetical protein